MDEMLEWKLCLPTVLRTFKFLASPLFSHLPQSARARRQPQAADSACAKIRRNWKRIFKFRAQRKILWVTQPIIHFVFGIVSKLEWIKNELRMVLKWIKNFVNLLWMYFRSCYDCREQQKSGKDFSRGDSQHWNGFSFLIRWYKMVMI